MTGSSSGNFSSEHPVKRSEISVNLEEFRGDWLMVMGDGKWDHRPYVIDMVTPSN